MRFDAPSARAKSAPRGGEEPVVFGGSMLGPTTASKAGAARTALAVPATPLNSRHASPDARSAGDDEDDEFESALLSILASAPAPAPSASSADPTTQRDSEQPKKQDGPYSDEEVAEIRRLKEERDGLRGMNAVLGDVLGSLRGMEGKMQVREDRLAQVGTQDLISHCPLRRTLDQPSRRRTPCSTCTRESRARQSTRRTCCWTASGAA